MFKSVLGYCNKKIRVGVAYGQKKCFSQFRGLGNPVATYGRFRVCEAYFLINVLISLQPRGQRNS